MTSTQIDLSTAVYSYSELTGEVYAEFDYMIDMEGLIVEAYIIFDSYNNVARQSAALASRRLLDADPS